jgi:hypothetical protein
MAHYLLFFPGANEPDDNLIGSVGLGSLMNSGLPTHWHRVLAGGPGGSDGMICTWMRGNRSTDPDPGQHKNFEWTPALEDRSRGLSANRFWFGIDPSNRPTPACLALPRRFPGHDVACADGNQWHIPAAVKLPHCHGMNESGEWERKIAARYKQFYDRSIAYGIAIYNEVDAVEALKMVNPDIADNEHVATINLNDADVHCCQALAINYRITPEIVDFLGLLDDSVMIGIISSTMDLPEIREVLSQKKSYCPVGIPVG